MKINLKKILGIGIGAAAVASSLLALLNNKKDFSTILDTATDEDLEREREKIRLDYCNPNLDENYRDRCWHRLKAFDREMSRRAWGDEEPKAPSYHREHGFYLPNDDDD